MTSTQSRIRPRRDWSLLPFQLRNPTAGFPSCLQLFFVPQGQLWDDLSFRLALSLETVAAAASSRELRNAENGRVLGGMCLTWSKPSALAPIFLCARMILIGACSPTVLQFVI